MIQQLALTLLVLGASTSGLHAFAPPSLRSQQPSSVASQDSSCILPRQEAISRNTLLWMAEESEGEAEEEAADEAAEASDAETEEDKEEEEEEEKEPEEDPEVTALKKEIAELESSLKIKRGTLSYTQDQAEEYSKAGYARKVAEMENMRRRRSSMNTSSRSSATAGILAEFLPVYDKMNDLNAKYADNEFGGKYSGLTLEPTFTKMGVKEYEVAPGDSLDRIRMLTKDTEHSTEFAKDTVISVLSSGLEMDGNVIRPADCVVSLGEEKVEEEEEAADEGESEEEAESSDEESSS